VCGNGNRNTLNYRAHTTPSKSALPLTHVWQRADRWSVAIKGALEGVLEHCAISPAARARAFAVMADLAGRGMRVLAVAGTARGNGPDAGRRDHARDRH
jgi:magnesium-transporting ATPase (P-type)